MLRQGKVVDDALLCRRCAPQLREGTPRTLQRGVLETRGRGHAGVDGEGQGPRGSRRCIAPAGEDAGDPLERGRNVRHVGRKRDTRRPRGVRRDRPERPRDEGREVARVGGERERALVDGPDGVAGGLVGHRGVPTGPRPAAVVRAWTAEAAIADGAAVGVVAGGPVLSGGIATGPRRGIARPGGVARVERGADDRVGAHAAPVLAGVGLRAGVAVVAGRAVGLVRRRRAHAGGGVAGAGVVALVRRADHRARSDAAPVLAGVGLRAGVAVVAGRAVGLVRRRRAHAGGGVAGAGVVALVRRADYRLRLHAALLISGVGLRAGVAVVAGRAVG